MNQNTERRPSAAERLASFLSAYRVVLSIAGVVLVVAIVGSVALFQIRAASIEDSAEQAESILELWDEWQATRPADDEEPSDDHRDVSAELDDAIEYARSEFPGTYADLRATFVAAEKAFVEGAWQTAEERYLDVAARFPESHLVAPSLAAAASAAEERGDLDTAATLWQRLAEGEGDPSPGGATRSVQLGPHFRSASARRRRRCVLQPCHR